VRKKHTRKKLVSVCIPVLNEEQNIESLYSELNLLARKAQNNFDFEFIFTDNRSTDLTWEKIRKIQKHDKRIRAYRFTKNIGFQQSIYFNYMKAKGDAVVQIDADLQDPPIVILDFLAGWVEGFKVVVGIRQKRSENRFINHFRKIGYTFLSRTARFRITENAGDFRLIDREVVEILRQSQNPEPYLRGAIAGLAYPEKKVIYDRKPRNAGESKIGFISVLKLGFEGLINYSNLLLKVSQVTFMFSLFLSTCGIVLYSYTKVFSKSSYLPPGFTSIIMLIFILLTTNSLFFAICIKYLQSIHNVVTRNEPIVVLDKIE
jgi:glycosyltransferase involved in cell wall biosynthesis